jgi:hypothetical protein
MVDDTKLHQFMGQMLSDLGGAASVALLRIGDCRRPIPDGGIGGRGYAIPAEAIQPAGFDPSLLVSTRVAQSRRAGWTCQISCSQKVTIVVEALPG